MHSVRGAPRSRDARVASGAEVVALTERFYGQVFVPAVLFVGIAAAGALALLPLRNSARPVGDGTPTVLLTELLVLAAPLAARRARAVYRLLRRHRALEAIPVLLAAALLVDPLRSELWWPSCALLMLIAVVAPLPRTLAYTVLVLAANLGAHGLAGDLADTSAVSIIGLWIGFGVWVTAVALFTDRVATYLLSLHLELGELARARPGVSPREEAPRDAQVVQPLELELGRARTDAAPLPRLTARQREVVALLADGLRYDDIAECLAISSGQVQRHVARAVARLGVRNANELVAVALAGGLVPRRNAHR